MADPATLATVMAKAAKVLRAARVARAGKTVIKAGVGVLVGALLALLLMVGAVFALFSSILEGVVDALPLAQEGESAATFFPPAASTGIPAVYWEMYTLPLVFVNPYLTASIHKQETGFSTHPSTRAGRNDHGCCAGPMQFNIDAGTWDEYKNSFRMWDGERPSSYPLDRRNTAALPSCAKVWRDTGCVYDDFDAITAAIEKLEDDGADLDLSSEGTREAVLAYNHSDRYADEVIGQAQEWQEMSLLEALARGADGEWKPGPGANRPGVDLTPTMRAFLDVMADAYASITDDAATLVVTTGTDHLRCVDDSNPCSVSDHWGGNGADFGTGAHGAPVNSNGDPVPDHPVGDRIAAAAFMAAGVPLLEAADRGRQGGSQRVISDAIGVRVQVIWKSDVGGNHHDHVHVGIGAA